MFAQRSSATRIITNKGSTSPCLLKCVPVVHKSPVKVSVKEQNYDIYMTTEISTLGCREGHSNYEKIRTLEQNTMNTKVVHDMRDKTEIAELFFDATGGVVTTLAAVGDGVAIKVVEGELVVEVGKLKRMSLLVTSLVDELAFW